MKTEPESTPQTNATEAVCLTLDPETRWLLMRDLALALLASEKATRNAIIAKGVEMEKQLEAMREAINAANVGLQSAMQYILSLPYFGNLEELETTEKVQAALAKLKHLLP